MLCPALAAVKPVKLSWGEVVRLDTFEKNKSLNLSLGESLEPSLSDGACLDQRGLVQHALEENWKD